MPRKRKSGAMNDKIMGGDGCEQSNCSTSEKWNRHLNRCRKKMEMTKINQNQMLKLHKSVTHLLRGF